LLLAKVNPVLLSVVAGHELDSQREGAAAVTLGVYTSTHYGADDRDDTISDHDIALAEVAKQYDGFIRERLGGASLIAETPESLNTADWLTAVQAAEILGLSASHTRKLVQRGTLTSEERPTGNIYKNKRSINLIPREEVEAELARRENSLSLEGLTREFNALGYNLTSWQLLPFAKANEVAFTKSGGRLAFPPASADLLLGLLEGRAEFLATHFIYAQMRAELGPKFYPALLQRWKARDLIRPVTPPIAHVGVGVGFREGYVVDEWFLRSDVIRVWNLTQPPSWGVPVAPERVPAPRSRSGRPGLEATG
jgi:hypothetical protein